MNKDKKTVTLPRGTPPASVAESAQKLGSLLKGVPNPEVEMPAETDHEPEPTEWPEEETEVKTQTENMEPQPSVLGTLKLEGDIVDLEIPYVDYQENDFSVLFVLPRDTKLGVKLKQSTTFTVDCGHVTRQSVLYVGPPMKFERAGLYLFFLLKDQEPRE